jgi:hypothetical protein
LHQSSCYAAGAKWQSIEVMANASALDKNPPFAPPPRLLNLVGDVIHRQPVVVLDNNDCTQQIFKTLSGTFIILDTLH